MKIILRSDKKLDGFVHDKVYVTKAHEQDEDYDMTFWVTDENGKVREVCDELFKIVEL